MKPPQGFTRSFSLALDDYLERSRPLASNPGNGPDPGQVRCSLEGGREYLLASQRPEGNFIYEWDHASGRVLEGDNAVRQAGALWSLALLYRRKPDDEALFLALKRGLDFFSRCSVPGPSSRTLVVDYGREGQGVTGATALVGLAIVDFLSANPPLTREERVALDGRLDAYTAFLVEALGADGRFASAYQTVGHRLVRSPSPYYDGEALLCLVKAAKYLGKASLRVPIALSAPALARYYTLPIVLGVEGSLPCQAFFQWGEMAFWELQDAGWLDPDVFGKVGVVLANWLIVDRHVHEKEGNQSFAVEGLLHALRSANSLGLERQAREILLVAEGLLGKVVSLQVREGRSGAPQPRGGFQNAARDTRLRIDVTQHSVHALLLAGDPLSNPGPVSKSIPASEVLP